MAATAALEAHRLEPDRAGSLALAASALDGARRAQAALASRPGSAPDAKLATYLRLKARPPPGMKTQTDVLQLQMRTRRTAACQPSTSSCRHD